MLLNNLWIEKYRPATLSDLCITDETRKIIEGFGKNIPHLLLTSQAGQGKTSLAKIIVQNILDCDYLYINASDENGIDTVREKIISFSRMKSFDGGLKVIILDEVDGFSKPAQDALRNTMEEYSATTRFILTGNYRHKIKPSLQSRCQSLTIRPSLRDCLARCLSILKTENVVVAADQKKLLVELGKLHCPDLRKCINEMQKYCRGGVLNLSKQPDNSGLCATIYDHIVARDSLSLRKYLIENDEIFSSEWEHLLSDLLNFIYKISIDDSKKKAMILTIADHLEKSSRVNDQEINFFACVLNLENVD